MKFGYLLIAISIAAGIFFGYKIYTARKKTLKYEGGFNRNIEKIYAIDNLWHPIPGTNKKHSIYPFIDEKSLPEPTPKFYFIQNEYPLMSEKNAQTNDIIYASLKTQKVNLIITLNDSSHVIITKFTLPNYTFRISPVPGNTFFSKSFDFKEKYNSIHYMDSSGKILKSYTPFEKEDDGGLSTDGYLLADDSCLYYVSEYSNKLIRINYHTDSINRYNSIEKITDYPRVAIKYGRFYSFANAPFLTHYGAFFYQDYIVLLSGARDDTGLSDRLKDFLYLDFYSKEEFGYKKSLLIKNIDAIKLNDIKMSDDKVVLYPNNTYKVISLK